MQFDEIFERCNQNLLKLSWLELLNTYIIDILLNDAERASAPKKLKIIDDRFISFWTKIAKIISERKFYKVSERLVWFNLHSFLIMDGQICICYYSSFWRVH